MFESHQPLENGSRATGSLAFSIAAHFVAVFLLLAIRFSASGTRVPAPANHLLLVAPLKDAPIAPSKPRLFSHPQFRAPTPETSHLELPAPAIVSAPNIEVAKASLPEIPKTPLPVATITASGFTGAKASAPIPAPSKPIVKIAQFHMEEAPTALPGRREQPVVGSFESNEAEGRVVRNARGASRASGFSDTAGVPTAGGRRGSVTRGGFGDTTVEKGPAVSKQTTAATITPVEIFFKPKPIYTDEARAKKIEGEVLLAMQFSASGEAHVERVMHGLGYGLDENAIAAAQGIRFRPATRDGGAVDSAAVVHIVFQLAQ